MAGVRARAVRVLQRRGLSTTPSSAGRNVKVRRSAPSSGPGLADFIRDSSPAADLSSVEESEMNIPTRITALEELEEPKSFFLETYGCQMNVSDSEIVRAILQEHGYYAAESAADADVVLLNTCAIRENAESKIWNRLEQLRQTKAKLLRLNQKRVPVVGVLGCMAERLKTKLLESDKMVDLVVGPDAYRDVPNLLKVVRSPDGAEQAANVQLSLEETYADIAPVRADPNSASAFVSVMRGCNNMCSYCIVPFTRGRERSRGIPSIVDEVKTLRDNGVKEIILLGQNVNSYHDKKSEGALEKGRGYVSADGFKNMFQSRDTPGFRFVDLLAQVSDVDPEVRVRFTSPHPKDFPDEVFDLMQERVNICNSVHMPAQSGSSSVLERMRRGYTREAYLSLVEKMRAKVPGVAISSDFIAGFCSETEEEHQDTLSLMRQVAYDHAFMFAYSMRARTHAAHRLEDDVPQDVKLRRLQEVIDTFGQVVTQKNLVEDSDRLHVVQVQGPSRRSTDEDPRLTGLTDTNKRCVFPNTTMPSSLIEFKNVVGSQWKAFSPVEGCTTGVTAQKGDYVLVRVKEAGRHTLHATPIARTSLVEVNAMIPTDVLGARPHEWQALRL